jgi:gas vesicle protein
MDCRGDPAGGGAVNERSAIVLSALAGAALGGLAGFLFLTDRGRQLRKDLEPRFDEFARELANLQGTVARARSAAAEGWRMVAEAGAEPAPRDWTREQGAPY